MDEPQGLRGGQAGPRDPEETQDNCPKALLRDQGSLVVLRGLGLPLFNQLTPIDTQQIVRDLDLALSREP